MRIFRGIRLAAAIVAVSAMVAGGAQANSLIPRLTAKVGVGAFCDFFYSVNLSEDSSVITPGSFVTLYDIPGYVAGSATITATNGVGVWVAGDSAIGPTGIGTTPTDTLALNAFVSYAAGPLQPGPVTDIVSFKIRSTFCNTGIIQFTGQDQNDETLLLEGNIGNTRGPSAVPELGTMPLFGGLLGLGGLALRRYRRK